MLHRRAKPVTHSLAIGVLLAMSGSLSAQPEIQQNPIFLDESPVVADALLRANDHLAAGNLDATADVLQKVLDEHSREVTPSKADAALYLPLRNAAHKLLTSNPDLLDRYRQRQATAAAEMLAQGHLEDLSRTRLLTEAGLQATVTLARRHLLDGHFDAAVLLLGDLAQHPDAVRERKRLQALVQQVAPFVTSPIRRAALAEMSAEALPAPIVDIPLTARRQPSVLVPSAVLPPDDLVPRPIGSGVFADETPIQLTLGMTREQMERVAPHARSLRLWPVLTPTSVIVTSGPRVWSFDRLTARLRWTVDGVSASGREVETTRGLDPQSGNRTIPNTDWEESTGPEIVGGTLVAVVAQDPDRITEGEEVIVGLDPESGAVRWSHGLSSLSPDLARANIRGPVLGDSGIAVVSLVKDQRERRLRAALLAGVDGLSGELRWVVPVASTGVLPYIGTQRLADALAVDAGVVYRSDRIGVIGAYRTIDGQPLWVRHVPTPVQGFDSSLNTTPWAMMAPVVVGRSLFLLSPDRDKVIELDAVTGAARAERSANDFGRPDYLLVAGDVLVGVSANRLSGAPLDGWNLNEVRFSASLPDLGIRGRVSVSGDRLLVPMEKGVSVVNPRALRERERFISLDAPGTPLATPQGLIVVDDARVHAYSNWTIAATELRRQAAAAPNDPSPAAELLSLAERSGRSDEVLPALELAAGAVKRAEAAGQRGVADASRSRIIELVLTIAQRTPTDGVAGGAILDSAGVQKLLELAEPVASAARERSAFLLVRAGFREASDAAGALGDAHAVLNDAALSAAPWAGARGSTTAGAEARVRIRQIVASKGRATYAAYDAQFERERAALPAGTPVAGFEKLAARFPGAIGVPELWLELAERQKDDQPAQARSLELGLVAAGDLPDARTATVSKLSGLLIGNLVARRLDAAAMDAVNRARSMSARGVVPTNDTGAIDLAAIQAELGERLLRSAALPAISAPSPTQDPQVLGGWAVMEALIRQPDAASAPFIAMQNADGRTALFGLPEGALVGEAATGQAAALQALWIDEKSRVRPDLLSVDSRGVVFFYADPAGGRLVRAEPASGAGGRGGPASEVVWSTEPFGQLFPQDAALKFGDQLDLPRVNTPDAGQRQASELIGVADGQTIVLVERAGRAAGFDAATGRLLWTARLNMQAAHEASLGPAGLFVGGMVATNSARVPTIVQIDARSGRVKHADPSPVGEVRWIRQSGTGQVFVGGMTGLALVETGVDVPLTTRWQLATHPAAVSFDAWLHEGRLLVMTDEPTRAIWRVDVSTGKPDEEPVDVRNKLETSGAIDLSLLPGGGFAVRSGRGLAVVDGQGKLLGADAMGGEESLVTPQRVAGAFTSIVASPAAMAEPGAPVVSSGYSLVIMDEKTARLTSATPIRLPVTPQRIATMPGRLIISAGHSTVIVHAPAR